MLKRFVSIAVLACVAGSWSPSADAEMCTLDVVPAATLLAPYFEVDTVADQGTGLAQRNTVLTLHNALAEPVLLQVTLWTDYSLPSMWFHLYLTGYDMVRFDLADAFLNGNLPITADQQSDPGDSISPHGIHSAWDGSFSGCDSIFPFFVNPVISASILERIRNGHTGQGVSSLSGGCLGSSYGDTVARGYITVDTVQRCALLGPHETGYFDGNDPVVSTTNAVWGEMTLMDRANDFSITEPLVHIEADPSFGAASNDAGYTFYGRFTQGQGGVDHREPLGTAYGAPYRGSGPFDGTDFIVWRDSTASTVPDSVDCKSAPAWYPLQEESVTCWNEQESVTTICAPGIVDDPACFPLETHRRTVGDGELALPWDDGWCRLDLDVPGDDFQGDVDFPANGGNTTQSYVMTMSYSTGRYAVGRPGVQLAHACDPINAEAGAEEASHD